jgi:hypothetical protein
VGKIVIGLASLLLLLTACTSLSKSAGQPASSSAPSGVITSPPALLESVDGKIRTAADIARLGLPLPFPGKEMTVSTDYVPVADSNYEGVYTGVSPSDPTEGMIIVISDEADASKSPFAPPRIVTETDTGALTITQVIGAELTLKDVHARRHTFDVLTNSFS